MELCRRAAHSVSETAHLGNGSLVFEFRKRTFSPHHHCAQRQYLQHASCTEHGSAIGSAHRVACHCSTWAVCPPHGGRRKQLLCLRVSACVEPCRDCAYRAAVTQHFQKCRVDLDPLDRVEELVTACACSWPFVRGRPTTMPGGVPADAGHGTQTVQRAAHKS